MFYERIYELDDGTELILISGKIIDNVRYLLLYEKNTDNVLVAYEENDELFFIDEDNDLYRELLPLLSSQIN